MDNQLILKSALRAGVVLYFVAPNIAAVAQSPTVEQKTSNSTVQFSTGINYSSGDYGDVRKTRVFSSNAGLKFANGPFSLKVTVPYVRISGPGSILDTPVGRDAANRDFRDTGSNSGSSSNSGSGSSSGNSGSSGSSGSGGSGSSGSGSSGSSGSGGSGSSGSGSGGSSSGGGSTSTGSTASASTEIVPVTPGTTSQKSSGIGDVSIALGYSFDLGSDLYLDASARVKVPTASRRKRLGTGKADVTAGLDVTRYFGKIAFYGGGRRKFAGKRAGSLQRDTWGATIGASADVGRTATVGLDFDWQQSSFKGTQSINEVTAYATFRVAERVSLNIYGSTGLNTNSVDAAGGVTLSYRF